MKGWEEDGVEQRGKVMITGQKPEKGEGVGEKDGREWKRDEKRMKWKRGKGMIT